MPPRSMHGALPVRSVALAHDALHTLELRVVPAEAGQHQPRRHAQRDGAAALGRSRHRGRRGGPEARPVERLLGRGVARRRLDGAAHERPRERGYRAGRVEARLGVHLAQLDGAEPRLRPGVPPDHRVVGRAAAGAHGVEGLRYSSHEPSTGGMPRPG